MERIRPEEYEALAHVGDMYIAELAEVLAEVGWVEDADGSWIPGHGAMISTKVGEKVHSAELRLDDAEEVLEDAEAE